MLPKDVIDFLGTNEEVRFIGVVEDVADPLASGRVRVRCFGFHNRKASEMPTNTLPWALVAAPTTSASNSGIGESSGLLVGTWVIGFFFDGRAAQYPCVTHSIPGIHGGVPGSGASNWCDTKNNPGGSIGAYGQIDNSPIGEGILEDDGSWVNAAFIDNNAAPYVSSDFPSIYGDEKKTKKAALASFLDLTKKVGKLRITPQGGTSYRRRTTRHPNGYAYDVQGGGIGSDLESKIQFAIQAVKSGFSGIGIPVRSGSSMGLVTVHIDVSKTCANWVYPGGSGRNPEGREIARRLNEATGWRPGMSRNELLQVIRARFGTINNTAQQNSDQSEHSNEFRDLEAPSAREGPVLDPNNLNTQADVATYTRQYLSERGYNDVQIAGILGTFQQESSLDPNAENSIGAFGLAQWLGPRRTALENFASGRGQSPSNVQTQLDFMISEFNDDEDDAFDQLQAATTVEDAVNAMNRFERFRGWQQGRNGAETGRRYEFAEQFYQGWGGNPNKLRNTSRAGTPGNHCNNGFVDRTNQFPTQGYRGEPSTNKHTRMNYSGIENMVEEPVIGIGGFPTDMGDRTFGSNVNKRNSQYPHNKIIATKTGHIFEMDDSPYSERVNLMHRTGSNLEIDAKGTRTERTVGDRILVDNRNSMHGVMGEYHLSSADSLFVTTQADMKTEVIGNYQTRVRNDKVETISGTASLNVRENIKMNSPLVAVQGDNVHIYGNATVNIYGASTVNIKSADALNMESGGDMNIKSGGSIKMSASGTMDIKSGGNMKADAPRIDLANGAEEATEATEAQTSNLKDLQIPGRTAYEKPSYNSKELVVPTRQDAIPVYSEDKLSQYRGTNEA